MVRPGEGRLEVVPGGLPGQKRQAGAVREPQPGVLPLQDGEQEAGTEGVVPGRASLSSRTEEADPGTSRQGAAERRRGVADADSENRNPRFRSPQEGLRAVGRGHDGARANLGKLLREVQRRVSQVESLGGYGVFLSHQKGLSAFLLQIVRQAPRRVGGLRGVELPASKLEPSDNHRRRTKNVDHQPDVNRRQVFTAG